MSILVPIILSLIFPILLWLGGVFQIAPNLRFKISALLVLAVWTIISFWLFNDSAYEVYVCWLAGILFILSSIFLVFLPWSVLCWGYTLSMLMRLAERDEAVSQEQWAKNYAGYLGTRGLSKNRATVLLGLGFAVVENDNLILTKRGQFSADCLRYVSQCFGVTQ